MIVKKVESEVELQRRYYAETASKYDEMHVNEDDPHAVALAFMAGMFGRLQVQSVLDVGAGTGRVLQYLKSHDPEVARLGVEPVAELRGIGHERGIGPSELIDGDAYSLAFADNTFDVVCAFGVMHHLKYPSRAIREMFRVARKAVFISDSNNFGQGSPVARLLKQVINSAGLWPLASWLKNGGKTYSMSEGDGLAYSYSLFNDVPMIDRLSSGIHFLNTSTSGGNLYRSAPHVALLALKRGSPLDHAIGNLRMA